MRRAAISCLLLLAGCATAPPPAAPASPAPPPQIPSAWPWPRHGGPLGTRCPACGRPFGDAPAPPPLLDDDEALRRASVGGRYRTLLRTLDVPGDRLVYGAFCDWGFWSGTSYAGFRDLPPGHWVYVHPRWYVWEEPGT